MDLLDKAKGKAGDAEKPVKAKAKAKPKAKAKRKTVKKAKLKLVKSAEDVPEYPEVGRVETLKGEVLVTRNAAYDLDEGAVDEVARRAPPARVDREYYVGLREKNKAKKAAKAVRKAKKAAKEKPKGVEYDLPSKGSCCGPAGMVFDAVEVRRVDFGTLKALVSVRLRGVVIRMFKVLETESGMQVLSPSREVVRDGEKGYYEIVKFESKGVKDQAFSEILAAYRGEGDACAKCPPGKNAVCNEEGMCLATSEKMPARVDF